jgi:uncharacterized membrane protein YgcG
MLCALYGTSVQGRLRSNSGESTTIMKYFYYLPFLGTVYVGLSYIKLPCQTSHVFAANWRRFSVRSMLSTLCVTLFVYSRIAFWLKFAGLNSHMQRLLLQFLLLSLSSSVWCSSSSSSSSSNGGSGSSSGGGSSSISSGGSSNLLWFITLRYVYRDTHKYPSSTIFY